MNRAGKVSSLPAHLVPVSFADNLPLMGARIHKGRKRPEAFLHSHPFHVFQSLPD